ncbi:MAG: hypothetical protein JJE09_07330 [Bacteroidia bacterium]|nr:hypothetical protein [Bacteroidia bacterium]
MIRKFFPLDKNYLLEEAQFALQAELLTQLINTVKTQYELRHNPLGIIDSFSERIQKFTPNEVTSLNHFYQILAGVYRYKFGNSQLEFVWDGREHFEKYKIDWTQTFITWTNEFCKQELFINAVLDLTVFLPGNEQAHLAENRMNHFILRQFELKIHKSKGIVAMRVA